MSDALTLAANTGSDWVSLQSLSLLDHPEIVEILERLRSELDQRAIRLGLPSLRMDSVSREVAELMRRPKESSLTFAPEAGTQRLRDAVNKRIRADDIAETFEHCAHAGWHKGPVGRFQPEDWANIAPQTLLPLRWLLMPLPPPPPPLLLVLLLLLLLVLPPLGKVLQPFAQ